MNRCAKVFLFYAISCDFPAIKSSTLWLIKQLACWVCLILPTRSRPKIYTLRVNKVYLYTLPVTEVLHFIYHRGYNEWAHSRPSKCAYSTMFDLKSKICVKRISNKQSFDFWYARIILYIHEQRLYIYLCNILYTNVDLRNVGNVTRFPKHRV